MSVALHFRNIALAANLVRLPIPSSRIRRNAWMVLARAFVDVDLPDEPMPLGTTEARGLRRQAATELAAAFRDAAKQAAQKPWRRAQHAALATRTDALWRELAATAPREIAQITAYQEHTAEQILIHLADEADLDGEEMRELCSRLAHDVENEAEHCEPLLHLFAQAGVPRKVFVRTARELSEH